MGGIEKASRKTERSQNIMESSKKRMTKKLTEYGCSDNEINRRNKQHS